MKVNVGEWAKNRIVQAAAAIVMGIGLITAVWAVDDRYAKDKIVVASMEQVLKQQKQMNQQQQQESNKRQIEIVKAKLDFYVQIQTNLDAQIERYKVLERKYPNDQSVKSHLENLRQSKIKVDASIMALQMELERIQ